MFEETGPKEVEGRAGVVTGLGKINYFDGRDEGGGNNDRG